MKSITNEKAKNEILERINSLNDIDARLWGKMTPHEAICHMADQLRLAMEMKKSDYRGNLLQKTLIKWLIMLGMQAPKGKVETFRELKQGEGGTKPINLEKDKVALIKLIDDFYYQFSPSKKVAHPAFGNLSREEWGKLAFSHLNHHLSQFGR